MGLIYYHLLNLQVVTPGRHRVCGLSSLPSASFTRRRHVPEMYMQFNQTMPLRK